MINAQNQLIEYTGKKDIIASFDCIWQKRGYHSNNAVSTCCSPQMKTVLAVAPMTKHCNFCKGKEESLECKCNISKKGKF